MGETCKGGFRVAKVAVGVSFMLQAFGVSGCARSGDVAVSFGLEAVQSFVALTGCHPKGLAIRAFEEGAPLVVFGPDLRLDPGLVVPDAIAPRTEGMGVGALSLQPGRSYLFRMTGYFSPGFAGLPTSLSESCDPVRIAAEGIKMRAAYPLLGRHPVVAVNGPTQLNLSAALSRQRVGWYNGSETPTFSWGTALEGDDGVVVSTPADFRNAVCSGGSTRLLVIEDQREGLFMLASHNSLSPSNDGPDKIGPLLPGRTYRIGLGPCVAGSGLETGRNSPAPVTVQISMSYLQRINWRGVVDSPSTVETHSPNIAFVF